MNQEQLKALKSKILNDLTPLAVSSDDAADRFGILLRIIQAGGASSDVYDKAYASARQIQDRDIQLSSLIALLDEVDYDETLAKNRPAAQTQRQQQQPAPQDAQQQ